MNNLAFTGKFMIETQELSKLPLLQKAKFLKQKDALIDEFCKSGTSFNKVANGFMADIKDEKESKFLEIVAKFGLALKKIIE